MNRQYRFSLSSFNLVLLLGIIFTLVYGEVPFKLVWEGILNRIQGVSDEWNPLLDERLPRLIVILCTGASLAISGLIMQSLFQNPLASPSVLGISTGGCLAVVIVFIFNWHLLHPSMIPLAAVSGCLITLLAVYVISQYQQGSPLTNLTLTGIALSTILLSIQGILLYALRHQWQLVQTITEWEAGSTWNRTWQHVHMQLPLTLVGLIGSFYYKKEMNLLALGEEEAENLGVDVQKVRWHLFLCVAFLTGGALAAVGLIAFFGLVIPHILRRWQGADHRYLIPLSILVGPTVLLFLDIFLRLFAIHSLSIGNLSALIGGGFFLSLLFRAQQHKTAY